MASLVGLRGLYILSTGVTRNCWAKIFFGPFFPPPWNLKLEMSSYEMEERMYRCQQGQKIDYDMDVYKKGTTDSSRANVSEVVSCPQ